MCWAYTENNVRRKPLERDEGMEQQVHKNGEAPITSKRASKVLRASD